MEKKEGERERGREREKEKKDRDRWNMIFAPRICRVFDTRTRVSYSIRHVVADIMALGLARKQHKLHKTRESPVECAGYPVFAIQLLHIPIHSSG